MNTHNHFPIDYYAYNSAIRNWNTGYKLLFATGAIITVIAADSILISIYTFIFMGFINTCIARLSPGEYLKAVKIPAMFILLGSLAIGTGFSQTAKGILSLDIGVTYLYFTKEGIMQMFNIILKALGAVSAMYLVTLSAPAGELVMVLKKLHLPGIFIELMHLIYRYIFILLDAAHKMRNAGEARLGYSSFRTSCKSFSMMLGNFLIVSIKNSRSYYDAMEARCYNGSLEFYTEKKKPARLQLLLMALYFILAAILAIILQLEETI